MPPEQFPRDKDELLREVDVRIRLRDIRRAHKLRERLAPKWWETGLIFLLFASALGLLASLFQYADVRDEPLNYWMLFWFGLMILTSVLCFEFLLFKVYNLNRSNEVLLRMIQDVQRRQEKVEKEIEAENETKEPAAERD